MQINCEIEIRRSPMKCMHQIAARPDNNHLDSTCGHSSNTMLNIERGSEETKTIKIWPIKPAVYIRRMIVEHQLRSFHVDKMLYAIIIAVYREMTHHMIRGATFAIVLCRYPPQKIPRQFFYSGSTSTSFRTAKLAACLYYGRALRV